MEQHLSLVILALALATGLLTSIAAAVYMPERQARFSRYFLANILLFNLLVLSGLVLRYFQMVLQAPGMESYSTILLVMLIVMAAFKLGWLYVFVLMTRVLPADIKPGALQYPLATLVLALLFLSAGVSTVAWVGSMDRLHQAAVILLETTVIAGAFIAAFKLLISAIALPDGRRRRSVLIFAAYHSCLMALILSTLIYGWVQTAPLNLIRILANGGFLILFNVFPLIWMFGLQPLQSISKTERFKSLGITPREQEIIQLIQAGKTNQEIADQLYISVATVKDHNHNIFRKCGTRNRLELANLFQ
jgi:DNA-binding CsgD family transcriptional regulator